jgi:hypothetical protein
MSSQIDPVVRTARREALIVFGIWLTALVYSVSTCYVLGYNRPVSEWTDPKLVLGFPEWVFWGIVVPWVSCSVISWVFAVVFVRDGELGEELEEAEDELGLGG